MSGELVVDVQPPASEDPRDAGLQVRCGEIHGVTGREGAGKTTLAHVLSGVIPMRGPRDARVAGYSLAHDADKVRGHTGLARGLAPFPEPRWRVAQHLRYVGALRDLSRAKVREAMDDCEAMLDLPEDARVGRLSAYDARLVELAGALLHNPDVVFYDDAFDGLSLESRKKLADDFKRVVKERRKPAIVFSTTQAATLYVLVQENERRHVVTPNPEGTMPRIRHSPTHASTYEAFLEDVLRKGDEDVNTSSR